MRRAPTACAEHAPARRDTPRRRAHDDRLDDDSRTRTSLGSPRRVQLARTRAAGLPRRAAIDYMRFASPVARRNEDVAAEQKEGTRIRGRGAPVSGTGRVLAQVSLPCCVSGLVGCALSKHCVDAYLCESVTAKLQPARRPSSACDAVLVVAAATPPIPRSSLAHLPLPCPACRTKSEAKPPPAASSIPGPDIPGAPAPRPPLRTTSHPGAPALALPLPARTRRLPRA